MLALVFLIRDGPCSPFQPHLPHLSRRHQSAVLPCWSSHTVGPALILGFIRTQYAVVLICCVVGLAQMDGAFPFPFPLSCFFGGWLAGWLQVERGPFADHQADAAFLGTPRWVSDPGAALRLFDGGTSRVCHKVPATGSASSPGRWGGCYPPIASPPPL